MDGIVYYFHRKVDRQNPSDKPEYTDKQIGKT